MRRLSCALVAVALCVTGVRGAADSVADAAMRGDRADVLAMIKRGADVNAPQGDGVTALHWAARRGDADLVTALVGAGANTRAATEFGAYTPLHLAAERGASAIVKALVSDATSPDAAASINGVG